MYNYSELSLEETTSSNDINTKENLQTPSQVQDAIEIDQDDEVSLDIEISDNVRELSDEYEYLSNGDDINTNDVNSMDNVESGRDFMDRFEISDDDIENLEESEEVESSRSINVKSKNNKHTKESIKDIDWSDPDDRRSATKPVLEVNKESGKAEYNQNENNHRSSNGEEKTEVEQKNKEIMEKKRDVDVAAREGKEEDIEYETKSTTNVFLNEGQDQYIINSKNTIQKENKNEHKDDIKISLEESKYDRGTTQELQLDTNIQALQTEEKEIADVPKVPIIVNIIGTEFLLVPFNDSSGFDMSHLVSLYDDNSILKVTIDEFFGLIRSNADLNDFFQFKVNEELVFEIPELGGLSITEDNIYSHDITIEDFIKAFNNLRLNSKNCETIPNSITFLITYQTRFITNFNSISELIRSGKGFEAIKNQKSAVTLDGLKTLKRHIDDGSSSNANHESKKPKLLKRNI